MFQKSDFWCRAVVLLLVLALMVPLLATCDDEDETTTPITTAAPTATAPTTSVSSDEPVKIGAIISWSGPSALAGVLAGKVIDVVEEEVAERGGILGGRPLKIIRQDDGGVATQLIAGWEKLVNNEKVSVVVFGGGIGNLTATSAELAQDYKTLYVDYGPYPRDLTEFTYTTRCTYDFTTSIYSAGEFALGTLQPKTAAILIDDVADTREQADHLRDMLEEGGVEVISYQAIPMDIVDLSPYLTKIRHDNPEVLFTGFSPNERYINMFKQIGEQGGWGDIKTVSWSPASSLSATVKQPTALGSYHWVLWAPGMVDTPAAQKFEQDFQAMNGGVDPSPVHSFFYNALWQAIYAIEGAGSTDPEEVAKFARSGQLEWDSPAGRIAIGPDGETGLKGFIVQVEEGGKLVPVFSLK